MSLQPASLSFPMLDGQSPEPASPAAALGEQRTHFALLLCVLFLQTWGQPPVSPPHPPCPAQVLTWPSLQWSGCALNCLSLVSGAADSASLNLRFLICLLALLIPPSPGLRGTVFCDSGMKPHTTHVRANFLRSPPVPGKRKPPLTSHPPPKGGLQPLRTSRASL